MFQSSVSIGETRVFERLVAGLEMEFGITAAEGLARQFIEAEGADFYWEARARERWLGSYESIDWDEEDALDRIAVSGILDGLHYVAVLLVDAFGSVDALLGVRHFDSEKAAVEAFETTA